MVVFVEKIILIFNRIKTSSEEQSMSKEGVHDARIYLEEEKYVGSDNFDARTKDTIPPTQPSGVFFSGANLPAQNKDISIEYDVEYLEAPDYELQNEDPCDDDFSTDPLSEAGSSKPAKRVSIVRKGFVV